VSVKLDVLTTITELVERVEARRDLPPPAVRKAVRKAARVSLDEVGAAVGVTGQAVWLWETGDREPNAENLSRYLDVLRALGRATYPDGNGSTKSASPAFDRARDSRERNFDDEPYQD
jgi:transcriptional regulator with XRE-family HTH domain